jgi:hypothetical protein
MSVTNWSRSTGLGNQPYPCAWAERDQPRPLGISVRQPLAQFEAGHHRCLDLAVMDTARSSVSVGMSQAQPHLR